MFAVNVLKYVIHVHPLVTGFILGLLYFHFWAAIDENHVGHSCLTKTVISEKDWFNLVTESRYDSAQVTKSAADTESRTQQLSDEEQNALRKRMYAKRPALISLEYHLRERLLLCVIVSNPNDLSITKLIESSLELDRGHHVNLFAQTRLMSTPVDPKAVTAINDTNVIVGIVNHLSDRKILQNYNYIMIINDQTFINRQNLWKFISDHLRPNPLEISASGLDDCQSHKPTAMILNQLSLDSCMFKNGIQIEFNLTCFTQKCVQNFNHLASYNLLYDSSDNLLVDENSFSETVIAYPVFTSKVYSSLLQLQEGLYEGEVDQRLGLIEAKLRMIDNESWPVFQEQLGLPLSRFEVIHWRLVTNNSVYFPNDIDTITSLTPDLMDDINHLKYSCLEYLNGSDKSLSAQIRLIYYRFDPRVGMEYKVHVETDGKVIQLEAVKPLNLIKIHHDSPFVDEKSSVILIVPVMGSNEVKDAIVFVTNYFRNVISRGHKTDTLILFSLFGKSSDGFDAYSDFRYIISDIQDRVKYLQIAMIQVNSSDEEPLNYIEDVLKLLSNHKLHSRFDPARDIILHLESPAMILSSQFINRVKMNTIRTRQMFAPIPFQEYKFRRKLDFNVPSDLQRDGDEEVPNYDGTVSDFQVSQENGYFDENHPINTFSFYLSDLLSLPNYRNVTLVKLFSSFSAESRSHDGFVSIFRAVDSGLKRFYRESVSCGNITSCVKHQQGSLGSKSQLAQIVLKLLKRN